MADRPDLDEFLSALNGFLEKNGPVSQDSSYLRFLEIFCRSVGSGEGHLLKHSEGRGLQSIVAFGIPPAFEKDLNQAMHVPGRASSPLDAAFRDQQVMAVVELKKETGIPDWFMEVMNRYGYKSLIAVPLVGQEKPVGILCAYYRDACLFDRGTLDRLMTVGRMVGAATEKSISIGSVEPPGSLNKSADEYLRLLTTQSVTESHVYRALTAILVKSLQPSGVVCGPVRLLNTQLVLTVADGSGIPPSIISQRLSLPPFLAKQMLLGKGSKIREQVPADEWGHFQPFLPGKAACALGQPVLWQKQPKAAIVAWRSGTKPFTDDEEALATRLAGITSLALQAV